MGRVLDFELQVEPDKLSQFKVANNYTLFSSEFVRRHGKHLIGTTTTTWFLLDIAFYGQNLAQKDIFPTMGLIKKANHVNALEEVFDTSRAMFIMALLGTFPGYWFTVFLIEKLGSTTFVLPAELFPTRLRSSCHALSTASGKAGAMVGAFGVQYFTLDGDVKKIRIAMLLLAFTNMLGFAFTFLVSETKGKSLEEISAEDDLGNDTTQGPAVKRSVSSSTSGTYA
nr:inorganic phosphate transporter 1-11 [Quercus suber]POF15673.1 inorganic phosphate transporter 1-11 [Quercus suber]